jgi:shikimate dehydrogenase
MKKYIVIGNPIDHSLSPKLHNFWYRQNNINADYEKKKMNIEEIKGLILALNEKKIHGINVTVPFKKDIIPFLDQLSLEAKSTQSVNTIYLKDEKAIGHNTDIDGFELAIKNLKINLIDKTILILGAGGVVPSLIFALNKMKVSKIIVSNRTQKKTENLKNLFRGIEVVDWGVIPNIDMIINATSLGLNKDDKFDLDFSELKNKFFYDVIYNPIETNFLKEGKKLGNIGENGKMMFIYQAQAAFKIWHGIQPIVNNELMNLLEQ